jgi:hypothetical protein
VFFDGFCDFVGEGGDGDFFFDFADVDLLFKIYDGIVFLGGGRFTSSMGLA